MHLEIDITVIYLEYHQQGYGERNDHRPLSTDAETKDFACLTSYPVQVWTGKNKAFCSPGTQNGRCVIKVYYLGAPPKS